MKRPNLSVSAILILPFSLAACTPYWAHDREDRYAKCPTVQLLAKARDWADPPVDGWQTRAEISEYGVECKLTKTTADIKITATVQAARSQNIAQEATLNFPMVIGVTRGDEIISKQLVSAPIKFAAGKREIETEVELPVSLPFIKLPDAAPDPAAPAPDDKDAQEKAEKAKKAKAKDPGTAADRTVIIGFQLTPDQLAYFEKQRDTKVQTTALPAPVAKAPTGMPAHILKDPTKK